MAYIESWSTKDEVLKDLARASGRRIKKNNIDESYLVIGDAPPPAIPEDEDAEMQLLFGDAACRKPVPEEDTTPDLAGIQQMLRMMQDFNSGDDDTVDQDNSKDCVIAISKVSKLNPNVPEFIPSSSTSTSKSSESKDINSNVVITQTRNVKSSKDTEVSDNKALEKETQDIAITLKNQISEAAKSDSFELKKQKNVAIATLLRLYANTNSSPAKNAAPLKLLTPEYYEGKKESSSNAVEAQVNVISSSTSSSTPEPRESSTNLPSTFSASTGSTTPYESPKLIDPEIKKSIDKVNRWLEEPSKRKSPAVCLGPIAFKRKEPNNCKSPISDAAPKTTKSSGDSKQYRPSKYAADLGKQYEERSKALESKQKDVTWTNLEQKLKEKDLIIKKRLEEQSASDS